MWWVPFKRTSLFSFRMESGENVCVLCGENGGQMNVVGQKGLNTMIQTSIKRQEYEMHKELTRLQQSLSSVHVHHNCRRRFVDLRKRSDSLPQQRNLRSSTDLSFDWKTCCFFCQKSASVGQGRDIIYHVRTSPIYAQLIRCAKARNDDLAQAVLARLESCNDLVAA